MKKLTPIALLAAAFAGAQETKNHTLTVGLENEYSVPNGHIQTRFGNLFSKWEGGWYTNVRFQEIELFRNGVKTFDKNAILTFGGSISKDFQFEVVGAPRLSGSRVAPWYGGEVRFLQGPLVLHFGARHYDAAQDVNDFRFGADYYWGAFRLAGEVIAPDRFASATFRGWFDWYYDEKGSVVGVFAAGPSNNVDLSIIGGQQTVMTTTVGLRATHMFTDRLGVTAAMEVAPIRTLGFGIVIRF